MEKDHNRLHRSGINSQRGESSTPAEFTEKKHNQNSGTHCSNVPSPPPGFAFPNCINAYRPVSELDVHATPSCYQNIFGNNFGQPQQQFPTNNGFGLQGGIAYPNFISQNHGAIGSYDQTEYTSLINHNQYNKNVTSNGYELDKGLNILLNAPSVLPHGGGVPNPNNQAFLRKTQPDDKSNNNEAIQPIIDTIVGSMAMSNGTYTHFRPVNNSMPMFQAENGSVYSRSEIMKDEQATNTIESFGTAHSAVGGGNCRSSNDSPIGTTGGPSFSGRSPTPSDAVDPGSRPQTPGKPSYSEILAKNASQNGPATNATTFRKFMSTSPSPSSNNKASSIGDVFLPASVQSHRKSVDYMNVSSNSSAASSSCASASSSPVAKQRVFSQSIVGRLFNPTKGKENSTEQNFKNSYARSTPSTTPTHQKQNTQLPRGGINNDRKVLTSQNSSKLKSKPKPAKLSSGQSSFDFEIEDLDDEGDIGWKTCTTRGRSVVNRQSNALGSVGKYTSNDIGGTGTGVLINLNKSDSENNNENEISNTSRRESLAEKKSIGTNSQSGGGVLVGGGFNSSSGIGGSQSQFHKKGREKEKTKSRKDGRNGMVRRIEKMVYLWGATMISAIAWLVKLVTDVVTLSISVGSTLMEDLYSWWINQALPACFQQIQGLEDQIKCGYHRIKQTLTWKMPFRRKSDDGSNDTKKDADELLAALGPERNITLPTNGDEALKRLLSCKGQDPYCILGVRSNCSDEMIRRYYKKQAVLVHPDKNLVVGAEEAFKILARAFELIGEPLKRHEYHHKLLEAHAKEQVYGEIGKLLEQLRKKMEVATSSIKCTKCNLRHKKNKTDRPLFAARYCSQCGIHHGAREGELWAERKGWLGLSWNYFTCMDCYIWEINEWAKCQKKNLQHIKADSHCVMYRLVANSQPGQQQGNGNTGQGSEGHFHVDAEDDWDSLINNLCKSTGGVPGSKSGSHFYQQGKGSNSCGSGGVNGPSTSNASASRKRKGKRK